MYYSCGTFAPYSCAAFAPRYSCGAFAVTIPVEDSLYERRGSVVKIISALVDGLTSCCATCSLLKLHCNLPYSSHGNSFSERYAEKRHVSCPLADISSVNDLFIREIVEKRHETGTKKD